MISSIITLLAMVYVVLYLFNSKKREYISYQLKKGIYCYSCKEEIDYEHAFSEEEHYRECKSCHRESQLNSVLRKPLISKGFIVTSKFSMIGLAFNMASVVFNLLSMVVWKPFGIVGSSLLFIGMTIFYIHFLAITRKKKKL